jgi:predicted nucleic acid-binding Zn ribbon protein
MPTLDEIYKQYEVSYPEHKHCSVCGAWMNGTTHARSEKVCAELQRLNTQNAELLAALESINQNGGVNWDYATIGNVARAAIAKAKGK